MSFIQTWAHKYLKMISEDHIGAYACQAAYFIMLSAIPFFIFMLTLLRYSPLTYEDLIETLQMLSPDTANSLFRPILYEVYTKSTIALTSFTIIFVLWSAGRGIMAITRGLNEIYNIHETRNYIHLRIISALYTFLLAVALLVTLGLLVFGNIIYQKISQWLPIFHEVAAFVISMRLLIMFAILMLFFIYIYRILPNKRTRLTHVLPGALGCSLGWIITSGVFSIYFNLSHNFSYMYGSMAGIMMIMLWLYACMYELFLGAELNNLLHPESISGDRQ